jgi:hypothetical protein
MITSVGTLSEGMPVTVTGGLGEIVSEGGWRQGEREEAKYLAASTPLSPPIKLRGHG